GVPRNSWRRGRPRVSRWHRPYIAALLLLDIGSATLASLTAIASLDQADAGFRAIDVWVFFAIAFGGLPLTWVVMLWANGAYDRRYLGLGTEEYKRVARASVAVAATVSFLAFATKTDLSRLSVAVALVAALCYILIMRAVARRMLHRARRRSGHATHRTLLVGTLPE